MQMSENATLLSRQINQNDALFQLAHIKESEFLFKPN